MVLPPIDFISKQEKKKMKDIHEAKKVHMCLVEFDDFKKKSAELSNLGFNEGEFEGYDFMINEHILMWLHLFILRDLKILR